MSGGAMEAGDLQELALRLSTVVDFLEERTERASEQARLGATALDQAALAFDGTLRQLPDAAARAIASQAQDAGGTLRWAQSWMKCAPFSALSLNRMPLFATMPTG